MIGDSVVLDYLIQEENSSYTYQLNMSGGDAFVISSDVQGIEVGIKEVKAKTMPQSLNMREGALVLTVERE